MKCLLTTLALGLGMLAVPTMPAAAQSQPRIEDLTPPKAAPPPKASEEESDDADLQRKRRERRRRERDLAPAPVPYAKKREEGLRSDTLQPRPRWFLMEISLVGGGVSTDDDRESYQMDPTSHFGLFWRDGAPAVDGKVGLWYGARVAPFSGTGFYKKRPGTYGLTYFGPMIGIGKVDPVPADDGSARATSTGNEDQLSTSGWLVSTGLAAVSRKSIQDGPAEDESTNDFVTKGVAIDASGFWLEARYLRILYGGLGFDVIVGTQTGRDKAFIYGGVGLGAWY